MKSAKAFVSTYLYGGYDIDGSYGMQCVDGAKIWMQYFLGSWQATNTGWAAGYATNKYNRAWFKNKGCTWIEDVSQLKNGDLCIWARGSSCYLTHVGMYYNGQIFGMNQGTGVFTLKTLKLDIIGAWRPPNGTCAESYVEIKTTTKKKTKKKTKKQYKDFYKEVLGIDRNAEEPQILEDLPAWEGHVIEELRQPLRLVGFDLTAFFMWVSLFLAGVKRHIKRGTGRA